MGLTGTAALPIKGIRIDRNRWLGGPVRFRHASQPDLVLQTTHDRIFADPHFGREGSLRARHRIHFGTLRKAPKLTCLAALIAFIFVPGFRVATVDQATRFIPVKDDIYVGNGVYGLLRIERTRITDARASWPTCAQSRHG